MAVSGSTGGTGVEFLKSIFRAGGGGRGAGEVYWALCLGDPWALLTKHARARGLIGVVESEKEPGRCVV